jgi:hypothetical protein
MALSIEAAFGPDPEADAGSDLIGTEKALW